MVVEYLKKEGAKNPVRSKDRYKEVATISANGDTEIGETLANIIDKVGAGGVVTVEDGQTFGLVEKYVEGMEFDKGYLSPYFAVGSEDQTVVIKKPAILITDKKISAAKELFAALERVVAGGTRDLVIIAEDVDGDAITNLILNKLKGHLNVVAVKAPAFGDRRKAMLEDIAILTGGKVITDEVGLSIENMQPEDFGHAETVKVTKEATTIINGSGDKKALKARMAQIENEMINVSSDYDKEKLAERLAKLSGGVAVLEVGAASEIEQKERRDRIDDALQAVRAAIEEGVAAGGGIALLNASTMLDKVKLNSDDERIGLTILKNALEAPFRNIMANAGKEAASYIREMKDGKGFDARHDKIVNMIEAGISDPVKVTRTALENAASVAMLLLTTEAVVSEIPAKEDHNHPPMPDMSGMDMM